MNAETISLIATLTLILIGTAALIAQNLHLI